MLFELVIESTSLRRRRRAANLPLIAPILPKMNPCIEAKEARFPMDPFTLEFFGCRHAVVNLYRTERMALYLTFVLSDKYSKLGAVALRPSMGALVAAPF